jgi:hypothetical protein
MRGQLLVLVLLCSFGRGAIAQNGASIVMFPVGFEKPFEVEAGSKIIIRVTGMMPTDEPVVFSYSEPPGDAADVSPFWTKWTAFTTQGDGNFNFEVTVTKTQYFWAGRGSFLSWTFSNAEKISILSSVRISGSDLKLCPGKDDSETLIVKGSYASYQWYMDDVAIQGATGSSYKALSPGNYKVIVNDNGKNVSSNTVRVRNFAVSISGSLTESNALALKADGGSAFQWWSGLSADAMSIVSGATQPDLKVVLPDEQRWYAVEANIGNCIVRSVARPILKAYFEKPVVKINASRNSGGKICYGSLITASLENKYGSYQWTFNGEPFGTDSTTTFFDAGAVNVRVTPRYWNEISLISSTYNVTDVVTVSKPTLFADPQSQWYCKGTEITVHLLNEGISYEWFKSDDGEITDSDRVSPSGDALDVVMGERSLYLRVVGTSNGCSNFAELTLVNSNRMPISISGEKNIVPDLICDSTTPVKLRVSEDLQDLFTDFQWYRASNLDGSNPIKLEGETRFDLNTSNPGFYFVTAVPISCGAARVKSEAVQLLTYKQASFDIANSLGSDMICKGEKVLLSIADDQASDWINIKWYERKIISTSKGSKYTNLLVASTVQYSPTRFGVFTAVAENKKCPAAGQISSRPYTIRPSYNPSIIDASREPHAWYHAAYDSIPNFLYCPGDKATLRLWSSNMPDDYYSKDRFTFKWYKSLYNSDENYVLGDVIAGADGPTLDVVAEKSFWYTVEIVDKNNPGCIGYSQVAIVDTWVSNSPVISYERNGELCDDDDAVGIAVADAESKWKNVKWYRDGELLNEFDNRQVIFATKPGNYYFDASKENCPTIFLRSEVLTIKMFPIVEIAENDTCLFALPELGNYSYQWYKNGVEIDTKSLPWIFLKKDLEVSARYTVNVSNGKCAGTSAPYEWVIAGEAPAIYKQLRVYPNPSNGVFDIHLPENTPVKSVLLFDVQGTRLLNVFPADARSVDLTTSPSGVYILQFKFKDGSSISKKIVKH